MCAEQFAGHLKLAHPADKLALLDRQIHRANPLLTAQYTGDAVPSRTHVGTWTLRPSGAKVIDEPGTQPPFGAGSMVSR